MKFLGKVLAVLFIVTSLTALLVVVPPARQPVFAQDEEETPPPPPVRQKTITVKYDAYEWWLIRWSTNEIVCRLFVDHPDRPTNGELGRECDEDIYYEWLETTTCEQATRGGNVRKCEGYYLFNAWTGQMEKQVVVDLPMPEVWLTVDGCMLEPPNNRCESLPSLVLTGEEPLPNEVIIRLQGTINGQPFSCPGFQCAIPLQPTGLQGIFIEFWADSSFGDSSKHYSAQVRALPWGDFMAPEGETTDQVTYYVDVISSQFREGSLTSCTDIWQVFPEIGGPPPWLTTPRRPQELDTSEGYYYLAGQLIQYGAVDASRCPGGGLSEPGIANNCGVEAAEPELIQWQNQFNQDILDVSRETGIPAQLMKNIFSRESQFWPGLYKNYQETGLGQMTENGADTLLLWNPDFFAEFCPLVLNRSICEQRTYGGMTDPEVAEFYEYYLPVLRGALVTKVNSSCEDCPLGIDLTQAKFSIRVFAETMLASCHQVSQMIYNTTERMPGQVASFVDLWKFTLVNYNAGPGCLGNAIENAWSESERLNWDLIMPQLEPACQSAVQYVEDVSRVPPPRPTPTPRIRVSGGEPVITIAPPLPPSDEPPPPPEAPATPTFTPSPTPTETPTPTATEEAP